MRVLVTGACGFVGPYLVQALSEAGHSIVASILSHKVVESHGEHSKPLHDLCEEIHELDVTKPDDCLELIGKVKPEGVIHLAGIAFAPQAAKNFSQALAINVGGTFNICSAIAEYVPGIPFVLASSGEVYGAVTAVDLPITEEQPTLPMNPYSVTKRQAEEVAQFFSRRKHLKAMLARPFNHIGPGQAEDFVCSSFAAQLARIARGENEPVIRVGNLEALRDFMDARDVVRGYAALLEAEEGIYNLSSGTSVKIDDILHILIDISGVEVKVEQDPERMRPSEVPEIRGSFDKMLTHFGWKPEIDIETSLRDIYQE